MVRFITDSRTAPTKRVPLQVIGAGLPRTATSSLQAAVEQLGFDPCLHMAHIIPHPDREQLVLDAAREKDKVRRQKLIHQLVDGYAAICDLPVNFLLADLVEMFPDAKIVLTGRTRPDDWANSARECFAFFFSPWFYAVGFLWKSDRLWYRINMQVLDWSFENFGNVNIFRPAMYDAYNKWAIEIFKANGRDYLEFKAEDGWKPLCEFLGKDVPVADFPRVNERKSIGIVKNIIITKGLISWVAFGGAAWLGWRYAPSIILSALRATRR